MLIPVIDFFVNVFGLKYDTAKKAVSIGLVCLVVLVFVMIGAVVLKSCNKPPKLNEAEAQKGEQAVKERNDRQLKEIFANADVREAAIDSNLKQAEEVRSQAVANYSNMNSQQLAEELEKRK